MNNRMFNELNEEEKTQVVTRAMNWFRDHISRVNELMREEDRDDTR